MKLSAWLTAGGLLAVAAVFSGGEVPPERIVPSDLIAAVETASKSVDMACVDLNSTALTDALRRAQDRGVRLRILIDKAAESRSQSVLLALFKDSTIRRLPAEEGLAASTALAYGVIDEESLWTLSRLNSRRVIPQPELQWDPVMAEAYAAEFESSWQQGTPRPGYARRARPLRRSSAP